MGMIFGQVWDVKSTDCIQTFKPPPPLRVSFRVPGPLPLFGRNEGFAGCRMERRVADDMCSFATLATYGVCWMLFVVGEMV